MKSDIVPSAATADPLAESIIKKVPGKILPIPAEKSAKIEQISHKTIDELRELLERQNKILTNKLLVNNLPDKGNRAKELKAKLEKELRSRDEIEKATSLFSEMKLGQLNALEWTRHCSPGQVQCKASNSCHPFHEETDPLKILASHSGAVAHMKQISFLGPEESFIKPDDFHDTNSAANEISLDFIKEDIKSSCNGSCEDTPLENKSSIPDLDTCVRPKPSALYNSHSFASSICERYGHKESKEKFKLNKPLKPFSGIFPTKPPGRISSKPHNWVETNVTPPPLIHGNAKLLSLEESIEVQHRQNLQLKEIQIKHAAERLSTLSSNGMCGQNIPSGVHDSLAYRRCVSDESESDEEASENESGQELHDEDQVDRGTTIVYNIES